MYSNFDATQIFICNKKFFQHVKIARQRKIFSTPSEDTHIPTDKDIFSRHLLNHLFSYVSTDFFIGPPCVSRKKIRDDVTILTELNYSRYNPLRDHDRSTPSSNRLMPSSYRQSAYCDARGRIRGTHLFTLCKFHPHRVQ